MAANQLFWTYAFLTMAAIVALLGAAVRVARGGRAITHRRFVMLAAAAAVLFVLAYLGKVAWLGREDKSGWSGVVLAFLYIHETFVLVMLITGGFAAWIGRRIFPGFDRGAVDGPAGNVTGGATAVPDAAGRRRHAGLGYTCLASAALALATGCVVYVGILLR